jgi:hypothetical protein
LNFEAPSFIIEKGRKEARKEGGKEDVEGREEGEKILSSNVIVDPWHGLDNF